MRSRLCNHCPNRVERPTPAAVTALRRLSATPPKASSLSNQLGITSEPHRVIISPGTTTSLKRHRSRTARAACSYLKEARVRKSQWP